ncbi:gamma-interferon-inducible protein 16 [Cavia porcellus]|uniref:gamma-interferon-inducible protein 16 n=1 Tax=Cavia porcellus TaxID=10141 RepID=UPI002FE3AE7F
MESTFKEIVLLQGLHPISDYHFRMIKSLLASELKLKGSKYEEYDKIKFADMMAEKFPSDAGLRKLISFFSKIPELEDTAELLKKQKAKVLDKKKCTVKDKTTRKRSKQDKLSAGRSTLTTDEDYKRESVLDVPLSKDTSRMNEQDIDCPTLQKKKKKKESSTKKTDDFGTNMEDLKMDVFAETSTPTTVLQSSPIPSPSSSLSSSAKEEENTITKRDNSTKTLEIKGSTNIIPHTGSCLQTPPKPSVTSLSSLHIPQRQPTPSNSQQSPQMLPTTVFTTGNSPHTSSRAVQTSQLHPKTPSCSLQTHETIVTPPSGVQILLLPSTTSSSSLQILQMPPVASSSVQTPQKPPTIPSCSLKTSLRPPKISSSSLQILQTPVVESSNLKTPQKSLTTFSNLITPLKSSKAPSSNLQIPQTPPVASSILQTPQKPPPTTSSSLQPTLKPPNAPSSSFQTPQILLATSSSLHTPQMIPATTSNSLLTMKPSPKYEPAEENGYQSGPKEVMVLKVTEPFTYVVTQSEHRMIHATVATENAFFRVKVFDMKFKDKFIPKNIIAISNYVGRNGFLEINKFSSVSNVSADRKMNIIPALIQQAKATPKISQLGSQSKGKYVNGIFLVCKKQVRPECIYYEIQDNTGKMEVFVHGRLTHIHCEEGDKLNLTCFEVASSWNGWQLRSVLHSHLKVIKARKNKI